MNMLSNIPPFLRPEWLWLVAPAIFIVSVAWLINFRLGKKDESEYAEAKLLKQFSQLPTLWGQVLPLLILNVVAVCLVVAAAGPYEPVAPIRLPAGSVRLVFVQDGSRSAAIEDWRQSNTLLGGPDCSSVKGACGSRIEVSKQILLNQIMPSLDGNSLGLADYAVTGKVQSYLNYDFSPLRDILTVFDWVRVGSGLGYSSHIEEGLKAAEKIFDRAGPQPGAEDVIVLATDGGFDGTQQDLDAELKSLSDKGRKLIILGLGNPIPSPIPIYNDEGSLTGQFKVNDKVVMIGRDDSFLEKLAKRANGQYIPVTPGQQLKINWPSTLSGHKVAFQTKNLYDRPLKLAMILLTVLWLRKLAIRALSLKVRFKRS